MISFAQNFEDVILNRVFQNKKNGFYIDIGAMDPTAESVTKWFYDQGWSGINIEPNPWFYEKLLAERPRDINLNVALGEKEEEKQFYVFERIGNSTFDPPSRDRYVEKGYEATQQTVRVNTLDAVCQKYATRPIDFLKVDCEGWEEQVLRSADWERFRPVVLVIEATEPGTPIPAWNAWEPWLIENAHYEMVYFDGLNRFYLRRESIDLRSHFQVPPNVFDEFTLFATVSAQQSNLALQQERESFTHQLANMSAQLAQQTLSCQNRVAEMEQERAELLNSAEAKTAELLNVIDLKTVEIELKTAEIDSLGRDLTSAQHLAAGLDSKLREARLWVGKLSQDVAVGKRR
jgi:FkbM family methyltransferase